VSGAIVIPKKSDQVIEFVVRLVIAWINDQTIFIGQRLTSWQRDLQTNAAVGGVPGSQHLVGTAMDFAPGSERMAVAFQLAGLEAIAEPFHTHVELAD